MRQALLAATLFFWPAVEAAAGKLDPIVREALARAPRAGGGVGLLGGAPSPAIPQGDINVLIRLAPGRSLRQLRLMYPGAEFRSQAGDVVTARLPFALLPALEGDSAVLQVAGPRKLKPVLHIARSSTTASGAILGVLQNGLSDLGSADGSGVIVGIVDTGIDWCHMDFRRDPGSPNVSRILNIWDQTISSDALGPFPAGFAYGAEYDTTDINTDLAAGCNFATVRSSDTNGHGTHVAGIAAGDGSATNGAEPAGKYTGIAPNADIIVVKTNFENWGVVDAMNYIAGRANALGKRAVINLSLGSQSGPHDGSDPFESAVAAVAASTPVTVAMGNDHSDSPHAKATIGVSGNTTFTVDMAQAGSVVFAEFWHDANDSYSVTAVPVCTPPPSTCSGSVVAVSASSQAASFAGAASIAIYNSTTTNANGDDLVLVTINDPAFEIDAVNINFARTAGGGSGVVDGFVDPAIDGAKFSSLVDNALTMTSPATANNVIAVGAHTSMLSWDFGTISPPETTLGQIATFSGRGPTRDGRLKPDVSAPGAAIASSSSAYQNPPSASSSRLLDGRHMVLQGTSMAAPMVAGAVALKLQVQPGASAAQVRSWVQSNARSDTQTGTLPNTTYGYGKLFAAPKVTAAPGSLSAVALGASSITFSWSLVESATSYHLFYSTNTTSLVAVVAAPPFTFTGLDSNFLTGLFVRGANATGLGPGGTTPSTATYAAEPLAVPTYTAHVTSVTAAYAACPAAPPGFCSGYRLVASTAPDFTGVQFASSTPNRLLTQLQISGLAAVTTYYFRFATLNQTGAMSAIAAGQIQTLSNFAAPVFAGFSTVAETALQLDWTSGGNPPGTTYRADASTDPAFGGTLYTQSAANLFSALFTGLSVNTTYYFRVQAVPNGPFLFQNAPTLSRPPAVLALPFSNMGTTQARLSWGVNGNPAGTHWRAEMDDDPGFGSVDSSSDTDNAFADLSGLTPNTTYYARVRSLSHGGTASSFVTMGSTPTLAAATLPDPVPFSGQSATGLTVHFLPGTNPAGTLFQAVISTDPNLNGVQISSLTRNLYATFVGLTANQTYYFTAGALNHTGASGGFFVPAVSTATLPLPPAASASFSSTPAPGSLRVAWLGNGNSAHSVFRAEVDDDPGFGSVDGTSVTGNLFAVFTGLLDNTTYYFRALTVSTAVPNPDSAYAALGAASTLSDPPAAPAPGTEFVSVTYGSVTVQWVPLAAAPQVDTCEGYRVEASTDALFRGTLLLGPVVGQAASVGGVSGLSHGTTYYVRVGALNWNGVGSYIVLGATRTALQNIAVATVTAAGVQFSLTPTNSPLLSITVRAPPGAFLPGTVLTLNSSVELELPAAQSNQAKTTALSGSGFSLSASGGLQPLAPVTLILAYAPGLLAPGADVRTLELARYDESARQWSLLPTTVDTASRYVIAQTGHFSLFAAFFVSAAADLSAAQVFPIPWEPGSRDARFNAVELTVSNLPADSRVRVFNISGELVWEGRASAGGVFTWHGKNRYGRPAGTGTYVLIIEGAGKRLASRAVLIR